MAWVIREARRLSWPTEAIFSETFVPPEVDNADNTRFEVELAHSGRVLTIEPNESLLDILNANGCPVICSCTQGICGSCMTPVFDGIPDHRDAVMTDAERAANDQMTVCVSRAKSARIVLDPSVRR
jgi:vanillate O-demethylase ferredoxin subunit